MDDFRTLREKKSGMSQRTEYHYGDVIGPYDDIIFIKEIDPNKGRRRGEFYCNKCNTNFESDISAVKRGKRGCHCPKIKDLSNKQFGKLTVLSFAGISDKTRQSLWKVRCSCEKHTEFIVSENSLTRGNTTSCGCSRTDTYISKAKERMIGKKFGRLTVLRINLDVRYDYDDSYTWDCQCDCPEHNIITVSTSNLIKGKVVSCGCIRSKGEQKIRTLLNKLKINYYQEYSFSDCINPTTRRPLRFDFYLPDFNCCIEFDGIQHFKKQTNGWYTEERFQEAQQRDRLKDQYCLKNRIWLIRIPYWDINKINKDYLFNLLPIKDSKGGA